MQENYHLSTWPHQGPMLPLLFLHGLGEHPLFGTSLLGFTFPLSSEKPQNSKYVGQFDMDPFRECPGSFHVSKHFQQVFTESFKLLPQGSP